MRYLGMIGAVALAACTDGEQVNLAAEEQANLLEPISPVADAALDRANDQAGSEPVVGGPSQWFARSRDGGQWAGYGPPNSEAAFSVRCQGDRLIFSTTEMPPSGPGATTMHLTARGVDQDLAAEASEQGLPNTEASARADAGWLTGLAAASGDLTVRVGGSDPLTVPIGEPLTSLIRDCRR